MCIRDRLWFTAFKRLSTLNITVTSKVPFSYTCLAPLFYPVCLRLVFTLLGQYFLWEFMFSQLGVSVVSGLSIECELFLRGLYISFSFRPSDSYMICYFFFNILVTMIPYSMSFYFLLLYCKFAFIFTLWYYRSVEYCLLANSLRILLPIPIPFQ